MGSPRTETRRRQRKAAKVRRVQQAQWRRDDANLGLRMVSGDNGVVLITSGPLTGAEQREAVARAYDHYHGKPGYETLVRPAGIRPYRG